MHDLGKFPQAPAPAPVPNFSFQEPPADASIDELRAALASLKLARGDYRSDKCPKALDEAETAIKVRIYEAEVAAEPLNQNKSVKALNDQLRALSAELAAAKAQ